MEGRVAIEGFTPTFYNVPPGNLSVSVSPFPPKLVPPIGQLHKECLAPFDLVIQREKTTPLLSLWCASNM